MPTYTNTRDTLGEQATLDALVAHSLTDFTDTDITQLGQYAFFKQSQMEEITLPNLESIASNAFSDCSGMKNFHIGKEKSSICTLANVSAFSNTGRSIIRVNPNLVSQYKESTPNWVQLAGRIYGEGTTAPVWDESEITDTDTELFDRINAGTAASYYKLGQYKSVDFGSLGTLRMQIIGINKDELASGGTAQLTWFPMELPSQKQKMNDSLNNNTEGTGTIGGWDKSYMKKEYLEKTIWGLVPSGWQGVIKEVKKYTRIYNTSGQAENDVMTTEKLFLLSNREVNGNYETPETLGPVYDFAFIDASTRVRKVGTSANYWWLRSAYSTSNFCRVYSNGSMNNSDASGRFGVGFGYCT